ncbi:hypothetical protein FRB94_001851, partial [Tulasnella sp. JGI-2019a]
MSTPVIERVAPLSPIGYRCFSLDAKKNNRNKSSTPDKLASFLESQSRLPSGRIGTCELCMQNSCNITQHHLTPRCMDKGTTPESVIANICRPCHVRIHQLVDVKSMAESYNSIEKLREHEGVRLWLDFKEEQQTDLSLWINATGYPADGPNPVALATHLESLRRKWPIRRTKGSPLRQLRSICRQAFPRERVERLHIELILLSQPGMKEWGSTLCGGGITQAEKN